MTWLDALQVGAVVIGSLGGGGAIVAGLSGYLGRTWADRLAERQRLASETGLANLRGQIDQALARLDASLEHQNFLLQRLADIELQGVRECWKQAVHAHHLLNGLRPVDCGTDQDALTARLVELGTAHNALLSANGEYDPFLDSRVRQLLEQIAYVVRLELSQASREAFTSRWWDQGAENQHRCEQHINDLRTSVQARVTALRQVADAGRAR